MHLAKTPSRGGRAERWLSQLAAALLWLLLFLAGCSTAPEIAPSPPEMRARLGTVAVSAVPFQEAMALAWAPRERGADALLAAGEGALEGFVAGVQFGGHLAQGCAGTGGEAALACLTIVAATFPIAAIVGALVGVVEVYRAGGDAEELGYDPAAMPRFRPEVELRRRFLRLGAAKTEVRLVDADAVDAIEGTHDGDAPPSHDSRIEIEISRFALVNHDRSGSTWSIDLAARARIVLAGEAGASYRRDWRYAGAKRRYFDAAEDDPALRADLGTALEGLAEKMVFDLLIATAPESGRGEPGAGPGMELR